MKNNLNIKEKKNLICETVIGSIIKKNIQLSRYIMSNVERWRKDVLDLDH